MTFCAAHSRKFLCKQFLHRAKEILFAFKRGIKGTVWLSSCWITKHNTPNMVAACFLEPFQRRPRCCYLFLAGYELLRTPAAMLIARRDLFYISRQPTFDNSVFGSLRQIISVCAGPSPHCVTGAIRSLEWTETTPIAPLVWFRKVYLMLLLWSGSYIIDYYLSESHRNKFAGGNSNIMVLALLA